MLISKFKKYVDFKVIGIIILIFATFMSYFKLQKIKANFQFLTNVKNYPLDDSIIVFVGGYSTNGLNLMKNILNDNQLIYCSEENRIINGILLFTKQHYKQINEMQRLLDAGIGKDIIEAATGAFIRELLVSLGRNTPNICHIDSNSLLYHDLISTFMPNTKYILMMDKKILDNFKKETDIENLDPFQSSYFKCLKIGQINCMIVFYDILLTDPKSEINKVFSFLNIPWNGDILTLVKEQLLEEQ
jgi:hypothetical protein